ncbi:MAG: SPOR domain-containing protein [Pseudomonadota bacterium]
MADYKHRASAKAKRRKNCSSGLWFFGGIITGAFAMGLVWLKLAPDLAAGKVPGMPTPNPQSAEAKPSPAPKPQFEFYTILPEMEVVIPDEEILPPRDISPPAAQAEVRPSASESKVAYILQMGSFRKFVDADRMKARLALIGIEAEIQKVSINNRDTYHRVRSGPFRKQADLNRVRRLASDNNISTLLIKLKE